MTCQSKFRQLNTPTSNDSYVLVREFLFVSKTFVFHINVSSFDLYVDLEYTFIGNSF